MKTHLASLLTLVLAFTAFLAPVTSAHANAADLKIRLVAEPNTIPGKGTAKYRDRSREQEFQVEIETSRRLVGMVFTVSVDDVVAGQVTIDVFGKGRLSLNSRRGQIVPQISPGSVVSLLADDGTLLMSGQF